MSTVPVPIWRPEHIEHLEKMFPELIDETDVNKLLVNQGARKVIFYMKAMMKNKGYV